MTDTDRQKALQGLVEAKGITRANPPLLLPADPYFDLAGEEFGRRLLLTTTNDGADYCLRPDFTLPIAMDYLQASPGEPRAFGYLGPIFRQRSRGILEVDQAGLELLAQPDPDAALDRVFAFAREALAIFDVANPVVRLGGVGLFEALLAGLEMPDAWRPRIRNRFGHPQALDRLLQRLKSPVTPQTDLPSRAALVEDVTAQMVAAGLSLTEGRNPEEIVERYFEQQALDAAPVPAATLTLLETYLAIKGEAPGALDTLDALARSAGIDVGAEIESLTRHVLSCGPDAPVTFDAGFSPRLDYYTGIVFEMTGRGGHVLASGGQYDRLLQRLGARAPMAAAGCAAWVDRLIEEAAR